MNFLEVKSKFLSLPITSPYVFVSITMASPWISQQDFNDVLGLFISPWRSMKPPVTFCGDPWWSLRSWASPPRGHPSCCPFDSGLPSTSPRPWLAQALRTLRWCRYIVIYIYIYINMYMYVYIYTHCMYRNAMQCNVMWCNATQCNVM